VINNAKPEDREMINNLIGLMKAQAEADADARKAEADARKAEAEARKIELLLEKKKQGIN